MSEVSEARALVLDAAVLDRSNKGGALSAALDAYHAAVRRQAIEDVWLAVDAQYGQITKPGNSVRVYQAWVLDIIAKLRDKGAA